RALLEPRMLAAVDLYQFTETGAPRPGLVDRERSLFARDPQARIAHPAPHGFLRETDAVAFPELLARQRRPEIGIALTHQRHGPRAQFDRQFPVTGQAPFGRHQSRRPTGLVAPAQPADLTRTQVQPLGRL